MSTPSQRGRRNRQKGQELEREVANLLSFATGREVKRILGQERDGGCDLHVPPLRIECKRRSSIAAMSWYYEAQALAADGEIPTVVMRADCEPPMVMMRLADFLSLVGDKLR